MEKKTALSIIIFILLVTVAAIALRSFSGEDDWICQDGQWVKHGNPSAPAPQTGCGEGSKKEADNSQDDNGPGNIAKSNEENTTTDTATVVDSDVTVNMPKTNETISSPFEIIGEAKGSWFFEGGFPVKMTDEDGKTIAEAPARALGEWMTADFVPFRAILEFSAPAGTEALLVLSPDDPSGQGKTKEIKIPVTLGKTTGMKVKLYFSSLYFDPETKDCAKVYEVERVVPKTPGVAKAALQELLAGITEEEKSGGYFTNINSDVNVQKISVIGGTARADFSKNIEEGIGGSCRTSAIKAQIEETIKQFPTVKNVVISVDGKTEGILQP